MESLPEDCFAHILSFASPKDVCHCSLVSSTIRSMADSDCTWEKWLPPNYQDILSRLVSPLVCTSPKQLFVRLCQPRLIDDGKKIFRVEKTTGKSCYTLSARDLLITWGSSPLYWTWKAFHHSRFAEVAELRTIWWLEIHGKINGRILSPRTFYGAYLIVKFADRAYGLDSLPSEVSVQVGNFKTNGTVFLRPIENITTMSDSVHKSEAVEASMKRLTSSSEEEDDWVAICLGSFYNEGDVEEEVQMCLKEIKGAHLKGGLIVEGIEIRPIN